MIKRLGLTFALGAGLLAGAALTNSTHALPVSGLGIDAQGLSAIEKTQLFVFGGRHWCFYVDGWNGPGWYWCGYAHRHGFGWGGGEGFHGWHHGGGRPGPRPRGIPHPHPAPHGKPGPRHH
jgi:hypothetical protein